MSELYDFAPLERLVYSGAAPRDRWVMSTGGVQERGRAAVVAHCLGVSDRSVHRWRMHGLSANVADRLAIRAGLHPLIVWPDPVTTEIPMRVPLAIPTVHGSE